MLWNAAQDYYSRRKRMQRKTTEKEEKIRITDCIEAPSAA
jgi:hypothetical protein